MSDILESRYPWKTVRDTIGDLPSLQAGESYSNDPLHYARLHSKEVLNREIMQLNPTTNTPEFIIGEYGSCYVYSKDFHPKPKEEFDKLEQEIAELT